MKYQLSTGVTTAFGSTSCAAFVEMPESSTSVVTIRMFAVKPDMIAASEAANPAKGWRPSE